MNPISVRSVAAAGALAASLCVGGAALAAAADTTTSVSSHSVVASPAPNPAVFAGTHDVAPQGKPLPAGYAVVARHVTITRGAEVAYAAMVISCPPGKRVRGLASTGQIGIQPFDHTVNPKTHGVSYIGRPSTIVVADFGRAGSKVGDTLTGTVYGLCR